MVQRDTYRHTGLLGEGWQPAKKASFMPLVEKLAECGLAAEKQTPSA
jgi:hypothetical protein